MKKNKKIFLNISSLFTLSSIVPFVVSCAVDSNSMESWNGSRRDLIMHLNSKNPIYQNAFSTDASLSNISTVLGNYDVQGRLISSYQVKEVSVSPDKNGQTYITDKNSSKFGQLIKPVASVKIYYKLQLAKSIIIVADNPDNPGSDIRVVFDNDDVDKNSLKFETSINNSKKFAKYHSGIKKIFIKIKDVYWVNKNGQKTKYKLTNKDFLTGFRRHYFHFLKKDSLRLNGSKYKQQIIKLGRWLTNYASGSYNFEENIDNRYLYTILGMDYKKFFGIHDDISANPFNDYNILKNENGDVSTDTLTFEFIDNIESNGNMFLRKIIGSETLPLSPAPYQFILENVDKRRTFTSPTGKNVVQSLPSESYLSKIGMFKYAYDFEGQLFVGPYYMSENNLFKTKVIKNKYFHDQKWVNSNETVNSLTTLYKTFDKNLEPKILYNLFKSGNHFFISQQHLKTGLSNNDLKTIFSYNGDNVSYQFNLNEYSSQHNLGWSSFPQLVKKGTGNGAKTIEELKYSNDNTAKVLWGYTAEELQEDDKNVGNANMTTGLVFRNNLAALINWYTVAQKFSSSENYWPFWVAPGSKLSDGTTFTEHIYGDNFNLPMPYYKMNESGIVEKAGEVTFLNNKNRFEGISGGENEYSVIDDKKTEIIQGFVSMLKRVFVDATDSEIVMEMVWPLRTEYNNKGIEIYKEIANYIESLNFNIGNNRIVKIKFKEMGNQKRESNQPDFRTHIRKYLLSNKGTHSWHGWSSDTPDFGGVFIGQGYPNDRVANNLLFATSYLADESIQKNNLSQTLFPNAKKFSLKMKNKINLEMQNWIKKLEESQSSIASKMWKSDTTDLKKASIIQKFKDFKYEKIHSLPTKWHTNSEFGVMKLTADDLDKVNISFLKEELNTALTVSIKKQYLTINNGGITIDQEIELAFELNSLAGAAITFEGRGFVLPSKNSPSIKLKKPWITLFPSARNGVTFLEEFRIKEKK